MLYYAEDRNSSSLIRMTYMNIWHPSYAYTFICIYLSRDQKLSIHNSQMIRLIDIYQEINEMCLPLIR